MDKTPETDMPIEKLVSRNFKHTYDIMHVDIYKLFKNFEITIAQFDLMETILLSSKQTLTIQELASSTVSLQPNITRMVTVLEKAGLLKRSSGTDRRIAMVRVTPKGKRLVTEIQKSLLEMHLNQYRNLSKGELLMLNEILIKISRP